MIKFKTGEMREEVEVNRKREGNPKGFYFVLILQEIKSTLWNRAFFTFQILNSEETKTMAYC